MPNTLVIADDITGANDIGIMYAKAGLHTLVYSFQEEQDVHYLDCDVLILDTDSRFDDGKRAYDKVFQAIRQVKCKEISQYFNKQCSVFRGNIGFEFDAMLDALEEQFAVVVLGFPANGRTTLHSEHYVYGTLLQESQFCLDPIHPMRESNLVNILKSQTKRMVTAIHYEVYDRGKAAVVAALKEAKAASNYCIMDVRDNSDLELLAELLQEERVLCGSSALSEYLARLKCAAGKKVVCVAGSLTPQTISQIQYMKRQGYVVLELNTKKLFNVSQQKNEIQRLMALAECGYEQENFVLIHSMNERTAVDETKSLALAAGFSNTEMSSLISRVLSELCAALVRKCQIKHIISCGGDTSATVCEQLHIQGMEILEELETGLALCKSVEPPYYKLVLKSGSFGSEQFIEKALEKL
jgi:uncharacterized protein YgbK (DUF1537 family)